MRRNAHRRFISHQIWSDKISLKEYMSPWHIEHDDVIKWKHFPHNWPFVRGIHRSPVNSSHKGQWRGALMFTLICVWINDWVNNREAGDLRRYCTHCDVIVMGGCTTSWSDPMDTEVKNQASRLRLASKTVAKILPNRLAQCCVTEFVEETLWYIYFVTVVHNIIKATLFRQCFNANTAISIQDY